MVISYMEEHVRTWAVGALVQEVLHVLLHRKISQGPKGKFSFSHWERIPPVWLVSLSLSSSSPFIIQTLTQKPKHEHTCTNIRKQTHTRTQTHTHRTREKKSVCVSDWMRHIKVGLYNTAQDELLPEHVPCLMLPYRQLRNLLVSSTVSVRGEASCCMHHVYNCHVQER